MRNVSFLIAIICPLALFIKGESIAAAEDKLRGEVSTAQQSDNNILLESQKFDAQLNVNNQNKNSLKGEINESDQNLWQNLNTQLIRGKCQLTPMLPTTAKITVSKSRILGSLKNNDFTLSSIKRDSLETLRLRAQMGGPILTTRRGSINHEMVEVDAQLAECIPQPQDQQGRNQWDLLEKEFHDAILRDQWDQWTNNLCMFLFVRWEQILTTHGSNSFHLIIHRNGSINSNIQWSHAEHGEDNKGFDDSAKSVLNNIANSPVLNYPSNSQVQEIHLQIIFTRGQ
jgi:hypothetical protein